AHSYSFSYRPNPDFSANFVEQPEIEAYLQQCVREFGLEPHLRLNTTISAARLTPEKTWQLTSSDGETFEFGAIINAMGGQHTAIYPDVPGIDSFEGDSWHSTYWNHDVNLEGKRIIVVGAAAAAVQVVPKIAPKAGHLTVLQRTPSWIMPRNYKAYSPLLKTMFARVPGLLSLWRRGQALMMGVVLEGVTLEHKRMEQFEERVHRFIEQSIPDPELRKAVTPTSRYGCKRGLVSDEFYPTLTRDNVELVADGLKEVTATGIVTSGGREIPADVIIYCTGYAVMDFDRIDITGENGLQLAQEMARAPVAYKGIATPGFPNYFFAAGPNGLAINVSYFTNVERNVKTIVSLLRNMREQGLKTIQVKRDVTERYNDGLAGRFATYSWGSTDCNSYYRTDTGHAPFLYP
ncbi:MAG: flavin-containing monooxygenase, partial [Halioglobus sp.]